MRDHHMIKQQKIVMDSKSLVFIHDYPGKDRSARRRHFHDNLINVPLQGKPPVSHESTGYHEVPSQVDVWFDVGLYKRCNKQ